MRGFVGTAPGTITFTLPSGEAVALADWIDDKFYSTVQIVNGQTTPLEAFSQTRGQPIAGGTRTVSRVDTNIPRAGDNGLPKDWEMWVYGWGVRIVRVMRANSSGNITLNDASGSFSDPATLETLFQIDRVTYLQYKYNGKPYTEGVMANYPQGNGFAVVTTNTGTELAQNGKPSPRDRIALVVPVWERENLSYKMEIQPEAALVIGQPATDEGTELTYADLKVEKYGLIKRAVN